jgi:hypothetical protein
MRAVALVSQRYLLLRILLFPGVIVHETAHVIACVLTNTKIEKISFWDEAGGSVLHHKPRLAYLTQPLISLAPLPLGIIVLIFLSLYVAPFSWLTIPIILVMMSIGATLAPSKTDFIHATEGLLFLFGLILAILIGAPILIQPMNEVLATLNQQLIVIVALLSGMLSLLFFSHSILRRRR